jgi:hypothetical protein
MVLYIEITSQQLSFRMVKYIGINMVNCTEKMARQLILGMVQAIGTIVMYISELPMLSIQIKINNKYSFLSYYKHGQNHRNNGPAIMYEDGTQLWCQHGKLHRDEGPAIIYSNGEHRWFNHGIRMG